MKLTRRGLFKGALIAFGGAMIAFLQRLISVPPAIAQSPTPTYAVYLPFVGRNPVSMAGTVVHVHNPSATTWNGQADFWNYVNQNSVNATVDAGLQNLTGMLSVADAWRRILPNYQAGQGIAIKVNLNNLVDGRINSVVPTLNALVRGMKLIGVREQDIWVYDAIRVVPNYYIAGCLYPGMRFYDDGTHTIAGFVSNDANAYVTFAPPAGVPNPGSVKITDVLINATYVIDMPLLKAHITAAEVTLGFKNHLGSTNNPSAFHPFIFPDLWYFRTDWNPLVDMYKNPHIRNKTVLSVGEGLFAGTYWESQPVTMTTFGNKTPNSLFFATDPVALDCVLHDHLTAEWSLKSSANNYLRLANLAGLGVFERGYPWGAGYSQIKYRKIEL